jgi:hypothetical protein
LKKPYGENFLRPVLSELILRPPERDGDHAMFAVQYVWFADPTGCWLRCDRTQIKGLYSAFNFSEISQNPELRLTCIREDSDEFDSPQKIHDDCVSVPISSQTFDNGLNPGSQGIISQLAVRPSLPRKCQL